LSSPVACSIGRYTDRCCYQRGLWPRPSAGLRRSHLGGPLPHLHSDPHQHDHRTSMLAASLGRLTAPAFAAHAPSRHWGRAGCGSHMRSCPQAVRPARFRVHRLSAKRAVDILKETSSMSEPAFVQSWKDW